VLWGRVALHALRYLATSAERNEIIENDGHAREEAAQCAPMRAMWKMKKVVSKSRQRLSFHNEKICPCQARRARVHP
jgi:hypothetical protein